MSLVRTYAVKCDRCGFVSHFYPTGKTARQKVKAADWIRIVPRRTRRLLRKPTIDFCNVCALTQK